MEWRKCQPDLAWQKDTGPEKQMGLVIMKTAMIDMPIILGRDLSPQEWAASLQQYREDMTAELQTMPATDPRYAEIERASRGLFWSDVIGRIQ
jgi:hypothetical protein